MITEHKFKIKKHLKLTGFFAEQKIPLGRALLQMITERKFKIKKHLKLTGFFAEQKISLGRALLQMITERKFKIKKHLKLTGFFAEQKIPLGRALLQMPKASLTLGFCFSIPRLKKLSLFTLGLEKQKTTSIEVVFWRLMRSRRDSNP
jgi:hypothetical protein